jgi:hypothetical protein
MDRDRLHRQQEKQIAVRFVMLLVLIEMPGRFPIRDLFREGAYDRHPSLVHHHRISRGAGTTNRAYVLQHIPHRRRTVNMIVSKAN